MEPAHFFETIGRLATGLASAEETAALLYGDPSAEDVRRLAIHERYLRWYRGSVIETHFPETRQQVLALRGAGAWDALVDRYFRAHPPKRLPMPGNASAFPAFLETCAAYAGLPSWVAEIADLEWLEWLVTSAPDHPGDADDDGPLRVTPTLRARTYAHDLIGWLDAADGHRGAGADRARSLILVWRDRTFVAQRGSFGRLDRAILDSVGGGADPSVDPDVLGDAFQPTEVRGTVTDLHMLGILRGRITLSLASPR